MIKLTMGARFSKHKVPKEADDTTPTCPGSGERYSELPPKEPTWNQTDSVTPTDGTATTSVKSATSSKTSVTGDPQSPPSLTSLSPTQTETTESSEMLTVNLSASVPTDSVAPRASRKTSSGMRKTETIPGVDEYAETLATFHQPKPMFDQPSRAGTSKVVTSAKPMTPKGLEIAHRVKEMFHGFTNRMERSQQSTMGPSEIGTPCDRRVAMSLLRLPRVNPGGDNWASFVGTYGHTGLAEMLVWADAGSGRYVTEERVEFPSRYVPKGTLDALDRMLTTVWDWKLMGQWSLDKLKIEGPSPQYRVQLHTYGYGLRIRGEVVSDVALIGMPRDKSTLDDLYVWTEPYNPQVARDALARVARIGETLADEDGADPLNFPINNTDCKYCPFHMPGAVRSEKGVCNGRT